MGAAAEEDVEGCGVGLGGWSNGVESVVGVECGVEAAVVDAGLHYDIDSLNRDLSVLFAEVFED